MRTLGPSSAALVQSSWSLLLMALVAGPFLGRIASYEVLLKENDDLHLLNYCICFVNWQIVQYICKLYLFCHFCNIFRGFWISLLFFVVKSKFVPCYYLFYLKLLLCSWLLSSRIMLRYLYIAFGSMWMWSYHTISMEFALSPCYACPLF